jgi:hypothetical protein
MDDDFAPDIARLVALLAQQPKQVVPQGRTVEEIFGLITPDTLCCHDGIRHESQLRVVLDGAPYVILLCSRRAGKTAGLGRKTLLKAISRPRQNILYVGLSKPHARKFFWNEVWKPLLETFNVPHKRLEDEMTTTFPNGSIVYVSGTDDIRHIESFLGNRLNMAIVDEAQSSPSSVLVPLTTRILPNALLDDMDNPGQLIMAGTVPDVNAGRFMDVWNEGKWSRHNWSRFENPYLKNQEGALATFLSGNPGLTRESPEVQREWFGRFVFDSSATAYTYDRDLNGYRPTLPDWLAETQLEIPQGSRLFAAKPLPGIEYFSCALDPGSIDRASVQVNGWGRTTPTVQHVFDWTSSRGAQLSWDAMGRILGLVVKRFNVGWWSYDAGSSKNELDTFGRLYGVPAVKAANKADLIGQVRLANSLLVSGKYKVMIGSALEEDYQKARWDADARAKGQWRWASAWHPDPSEASRYSLAPYFDAYVKPAPPITNELEKHRAEVREMLREAKALDERAESMDRDIGWG